jgi:hypothetical protein
LVLIDIHPDNLARHPGADLYQVSIHLGVVRVFVIRGMPPEQQCAHNKHGDHADDDKAAPPLLTRKIVEILLVVVAGLGTLYFDGSCTA